MYDLIGDIHGHADRLQILLLTLGYKKKSGVYSHPDRKVLFIGDYIDRGPQIPETLQIVKSMVETGNAIALMGNHEYNALCFHFQETDGGHLRKHEIKNIIQHFETLKQFHNNQKEYEDYLEWFKTLPLYFEDDNLRAVHACWDADNIDFLKKKLVDSCLTDELIIESVKMHTPFNDVIEQTLKGKEIALPQNMSFTDKDGTIRHHMRVKWWEDPSKATYKSYSVVPIEALPETPIEEANRTFYPHDNKPVFFGHYWLKGQPMLYRNNVCCLDYSVAKGGVLVAYRYSGEQELRNENFVI